MTRTVQIETSSLQIGMHVVELDRPWLETPFLLQGFRISSDDQIRRLQEYCKHVYILPNFRAGVPGKADDSKKKKLSLRSRARPSSSSSANSRS